VRGRRRRDLAAADRRLGAITWATLVAVCCLPGGVIVRFGPSETQPAVERALDGLRKAGA
jgi:hypothetical protein